MFTVDGYLGGISYHAVVGGDTSGVARGCVAGCVVTDPATAAWLDEQSGEPWQATPTGPAGITDLNDPASVLGTLMDHTEITSISGDAPDLLGPQVPGAVY